MSRKRNKNEALVYSTGQGRMCPSCSEPVARCRCILQKTSGADDGIVRVGRQTKGRKGRGVTLISGLPLDRDGLKEISLQFKRKCGSGGTVKNGVVEIQGDHRAMLVDELEKLGYRVKQTGG